MKNSKYLAVWLYVKNSGLDTLVLTFNEIERILSFKIDHSFLTFKKELLEYGYTIKKISLKEEKIVFIKVKNE